MGGASKGDRKSYKATSAAKAAEALAAKGGAAGFGGFSGTRPVAGFGFGAPAAASNASLVGGASAGGAAGADPLELSAQLDGELAQCLRHLSKRDTITKLKALQSLEELIGQKTAADLSIMLQPWSYHFKRLLMDSSKAVRIKAAAVMAAVAVAVGKALLPQLKSLLGPWYLASFDPYPDAAAAAKKSLAEVFPGKKQLDALMYCRSDVLAHIATCMSATPASLGDPKKDTPEELEERHERVLTASLSAAAALLSTSMMQQGSQAGDSSSSSTATAAAATGTDGGSAAAAAAACQDVQDKVSEMMAVPGFFKQKLNSKSPVVQRAAYGFITAVSSSAPQLLKPCLAAAAPAVLGALQDKEPSNHAAMWEMLLSFVTSQQPDCWAAVNVLKAVIPRLLSLLRHGCYGSLQTSLPAVLPFLALLPRAVLSLQPLLLLDQVLESLWIGQQQQGVAARGDRTTMAAVAAAYQECLSWGLRNAAALAASASAAAGEGAGSSRNPKEAASIAHGSGAVDGSSSSSSSSSSSGAAEYCSRLLLTGHFTALLQLSLSSSSTSGDAQLSSDIVLAVLLQQCAAPLGSASAVAAAAAGGVNANHQLQLQLQVLLAALGNSVQAALSRACLSQQQQQPTSADGVPSADATAAPVSREAAVNATCLRVQQLLDALADSSSPHSHAAAVQLAGACCTVLLPLVQAGQQLPAAAANLLAGLIRQYPEAASIAPGSSIAAAAAPSAGELATGMGTSTTPAATAAGGGGSSSSIAALVKLGISSCTAGSELAAADAELLLSCVGGSGDASVAWGVLLDQVLAEGHTPGAWRFLDALLRQAVSSGQLAPASTAAAAAPAPASVNNWSHPLLDAFVCELLQQLQQPVSPAAGAGAAAGSVASLQGSGDGGGGGSSARACSCGLPRPQAAAASLLGCCLGGNKQQSVLLGPDALEACMESMRDVLSITLQQQQQQQQHHGPARQQPPNRAAAPMIAALCIVLEGSAHVASSVTCGGSDRGSGGGSSSSNSKALWQQQPEHLTQLLLLLWQLAWGAEGNDSTGLMALADIDSDSSDGSEAGSSVADSGSDSDLTDTSSQVSEGAATEGQDAAAAAGLAAALDTTSSSSAAEAAWQVVLAAARRVWSSPELLAVAVTELPEASAACLMQRLQEVLVEGLQTAAAAAASSAAPSTKPDHSNDTAAVDALLVAGTQWACRAAAVFEGLQALPEQQQELVQQLLAAVDSWQRWSPCLLLTNSRRHGSSSGEVDPVHVMMLQFASVLLLQAGCDVVLPLHHGHLLPRSVELSDSSGACSSSGAAADEGRLWLRLELLCAQSALEGIPTQAQLISSNSDAGSARGGAGLAQAKCVSAAAAAAQRQLVRAAGKGSSGAASAVARTQLASALGLLLAAASGDSSNRNIPSSLQDAQVYNTALQHLLARTVSTTSASVAARVHLQPVLEQFALQHVAPAVAACISQATPAAAATERLAPIAELCAQALRFAAGDGASLAASGFADMTVQLMHKVTSLPLPEAADAASCALDGTPLQLLQLTVACFPVKDNRQQQQQQGQPSRTQVQQVAACTAAERQGLAALLRHVCKHTPPPAVDASAGAAAAAAAAVAAQAQCQLQLCCVRYCWAEMMAAEWHIVLRDTQQRLTSARREVEKAAGTLAGAVCSAAQQVLGGRGSASAEAMSATTAVQLVRRLQQKGLLQQQPAVAEALLAAATDAAGRLSQLSVLQVALDVLASVLQLEEQVQAAGRAPQLSLALAAAWRELLSLLLALGAAVAVAGCCGETCQHTLLQYCEERGSTWQVLQQCLHSCREADGDAVGKVLAAADDKTELLGVDAVSSCLALLQQGGFHHHHQHHQQQPGPSEQQQQQHGCEPLQQLAWELLLHPHNLAGISHAATSAAAADDDAEAVPEYGVNDDAAAYLVKVGLRPEMAAGLASSKPWQMHLLLWALLLAHVAKLPARSMGQRRLCQALREVPELVPQVLDRVASLMGLGGSNKGSSAAPAGGAAAAGSELPAATVALSAAAQASLSASLQAAGTNAGSSAASVMSGGGGADERPSRIWDAAVALRSIGLPHSHSSWRLLAAAVYRAVLCTLPASARLWFSDLRDRSRSTAVEAYTSRYESPALLAAEFAAIKRDAAGSSGEVGGSCSFRVVANPANREVTAVLEIEDGATLELVVKLPAAAPLKAPEVDCKNKVGIKDGRLRKWLLSIAVFLRNQNQGVLDGISMWKANLEQEFAGVEACLICYSVISAANGQLPRISCKQCHVKFHPACLYRWLRTSGKSTCPHCQALL